MNSYVRLADYGNRGWPRPESSFGLGPMYGEDGWCHDCGVTLREQTGSMIVKIAPKSVPIGVWTPNWLHDCQVLSEDLAAEVAARSSVRLLPVVLRPASSRPRQIVPVVTPNPWFDEKSLAEAVRGAHGAEGRTCPKCGTWRWFGIPIEYAPPVRVTVEWEPHDAVASPEWFGSEWNAWRHVLIRRHLAELIVAANPRRAKIIEVATV